MTDLFYNPRPAVNFLTLRTNAGFKGGHVLSRGGSHVKDQHQANALPLGFGFAPEIPESIISEMVGPRVARESTNIATGQMNRGNSELQTTVWK